MLLKNIKKTLFFIFIFIICLLSYFKLADAYNQNTVEYTLGRSLNKSDIKKIENYLLVPDENIEFSGYNSQNVFMITGNKNNFFEDKYIAGRMPIYDNEIALGKELGQSYFNTTDFIDKKYSFLDKEYFVVGIIDEKDIVLLKYNENLLDVGWENIKVYLEVKNESNIYAQAYQTKRYLESLDIKVIKMLVYKEKFIILKNIANLSFIFIASIWIRYLVANMKKHTMIMHNYYQSNKRTREVEKIIGDLAKEIYLVVLEIIGVLFGTFTIFKNLKNFGKIDKYIPQNFMSIADYYQIVKNMILELENTLLVGLSNLEISMTYILIFDITIILIGYKCIKRQKNIRIKD